MSDHTCNCTNLVGENVVFVSHPSGKPFNPPVYGKIVGVDPNSTSFLIVTSSGDNGGRIALYSTRDFKLTA